VEVLQILKQVRGFAPEHLTTYNNLKEEGIESIKMMRNRDEKPNG
jgi:aryl carrier-like protein